MLIVFKPSTCFLGFALFFSYLRDVLTFTTVDCSFFYLSFFMSIFVLWILKLNYQAYTCLYLLFISGEFFFLNYNTPVFKSGDRGKRFPCFEIYFCLYWYIYTQVFTWLEVIYDFLPSYFINSVFYYWGCISWCSIVYIFWFSFTLTVF